MQVAQPPGGDQPGRQRQAVPGHHELHRGRARVQAALDVRQRHVDDEEVQQGNEGPGQQDRERAPGGTRRAARGRGRLFDDSHDSLLIDDFE